MIKRRKSQTIFNAICISFLKYMIIVVFIVVIGVWFLTYNILCSKMENIQFIIIENTKTILSIFYKSIEIKEREIENNLLAHLQEIQKKIKKDFQVEELENTSIITLIVSPQGKVLQTNNPDFKDISFDKFPFFRRAVNVINEGKIAAPRAFTINIADKKTFYKFIFSKSEDDNILALGKQIPYNEGLKPGWKLYDQKIQEAIPIVKDIQIIYPGEITEYFLNTDVIYLDSLSPTFDITDVSNYLVTLEKSHQMMEKIEFRLLMTPVKRTTIAVWKTDSYNYSFPNVVEIPQTYLIVLSLEFSKTIFNTMTIVIITILTITILISIVGFSFYQHTKYVHSDLAYITNALQNGN